MNKGCQLRQYGKIKTYNQERGFGFIALDDGKDLFYHIKDFPSAQLPQIGEKLSFQIKQEQNKTRAIHIIRLDHSSDKSILQHEVISAPTWKKGIKERKSQASFPLFSWMFVVIMILGSAYFIGGQVQQYLHRKNLAEQPVTTQNLKVANTVAITPTTSDFKCDGRIHCSQMNSKAEADWFVRNCPGTKMDGDGDGDACENDSRW
ncbi:cold shock domain-containing protein [Acinetobacter sp. MD2]|uniref:cold shock domain-containing protein n=1 Tax=Acinetobacter sp. MD2 TaxID=2600066 RepID=UPI002D7862CC|nr:cold shock domain-containing protein [Acinetobacter sp. MD2]